MIADKVKEELTRQHYKIVGNHSGVKLCHWTKKSIKDEGFCYKQKFYGIESHRCMQMTPSIFSCTHNCIFCWRNIDFDYINGDVKADNPKEIIDNAIIAQRQLLSGFGGIPERINKKKFKEAQNPRHAAISLAGEPTLYEKLDGLIEEFHKRNFTTYLVTNGTVPERLISLKNMPTQLYVSLVSPDEDTYERICNPMITEGWKKINETLELFNSFNTKKVIRLTLVKNLNMFNPEKYAKLIEKANPDYVEAKAFMFVGGSRQRLTIENMPSFQEIMEFSKKMENEVGYKIKDYKEDSRVVLLSK